MLSRCGTEDVEKAIICVQEQLNPNGLTWNG